MTNISWYNVSKLLFTLVSFSINFDVDSWHFHRFCCINCCFHWEICIRFLWLHLLSFLYLCSLWTKLSNMIVSLPRMSNTTFWRCKNMFECASHSRFHVQRILPNAHKGIRSQLMSMTCDQNLQTVSEFTRSYNIANVLWVSSIGTDVNLGIV